MKHSKRKGAHAYDGTMDDIKIKVIAHALNAAQGNRTLAAARLGISLRTITTYLSIKPELRTAYPRRRNQHDTLMSSKNVQGKNNE